MSAACGSGPPDLARVQTGLAQYLLAEKRRDNDPFLEWIVPRPGRSAVEQLALYRQLVRANHTQALRDTYPCCHALVGDAYFKQLGALYFARYPTPAADLNRYGGAFAAMLTALEEERDEIAVLPFLADLARLEWAWQQLNGQAEPARLDMVALAEIPAERHAALRLHPNPTLVRLELGYAVHGLWDALLQGEQADAPAHEPVLLLLWRHAGQRWVRRLGAAENEWVQTYLENGFDGRGDWGEAEMLQAALLGGWICDFSLGDKAEP